MAVNIRARIPASIIRAAIQIGGNAMNTNGLNHYEKEIILNIIARKRIERRQKAERAKERREAIEAALIWPMAFLGMASWYLIIYALGG